MTAFIAGTSQVVLYLIPYTLNSYDLAVSTVLTACTRKAAECGHTGMAENTTATTTNSFSFGYPLSSSAGL